MPSRRYTLVIADRTTGVARRFTIGLGPAFLVVGVLAFVPILIGLGARWSATAEISGLQAGNATLTLENDSFRRMTGELTSQITSLQASLADIDRSAIDPVTGRVLDELPRLNRARSAGGAASTAAAAAALSPGFVSPENTFGVLQDLLGALEARLSLVQTRLDQRQAVVAAIPSIWPTHGWLSSSYGRRRDPFTGQPDFHPALDISADRGQPVYATASGTVTSAAYTGAYGNLVIIEHGFGMNTRYGHLSRFAVRPGQRVERGQIIGSVGATGRASGSHVHYEVWIDGRPVNPLRLLDSKLPR